MWDKYSDDDKAIAIQSRARDLFDVLPDFDSDDRVGTHVSPVSYADFDSPIETLDEQSVDVFDTIVGEISDEGTRIIDLYRLKRIEFMHEQEIRAAIQPHGVFFEHIAKDGPDNISPEDIWAESATSSHENVEITGGGSGLNISVDLDRLIEKVYCAPNTPGWVVESIKLALENQTDIGLNGSDVVESTIGESPDWR